VAPTHRAAHQECPTINTGWNLLEKQSIRCRRIVKGDLMKGLGWT